MAWKLISEVKWVCVQRTTSEFYVTWLFVLISLVSLTVKENRIYIRVEFRNPSVWILPVPLSLKVSSKCTIHVNIYKLYSMETVQQKSRFTLFFRVNSTLIYSILFGLIVVSFFHCFIGFIINSPITQQFYSVHRPISCNYVISSFS